MMPLFLGWRCGRALLKLNTTTTTTSATATATATSLLNLIRHNSSFPSSQHHDHDHGVSSTPASTEKCYCPNNLNGRILILAKKEKEKEREQFLYSAEIHEGGNVGPATLVATVPLKRDTSLCNRFSIPQLVNGLLCFRDRNDIVILNPSTGHFFTLPPQHHTSSRLTGFSFADNLSNQFKVLNIDLEFDSNLHFWALKQRERVPCSIYSFGDGDGDGNGNDVNNNWRPIQPQIPGDDHWDTLAFYDINRNSLAFPDITSVSVNGAMHWNVGLYDTKSPEPCLDLYWNPKPYKRNIMAFDPQEESFKLIPLPADDKGEPIRGSLSVSCGRLCIQQNYYDKIDLWILEDYHNHKWVKQTFNFPFELNRKSAFRAINTNTGEVLLESNEPKVSLLYYHKKTGIFKRLEIEGLPQWMAELPYIGCIGFGSFPGRVLLIDFRFLR